MLPAFGQTDRAVLVVCTVHAQVRGQWMQAPLSRRLPGVTHPVAQTNGRHPVRALAVRLQHCRRYWRGVMMTMYRHRRWACRRRVAGLQPPAARGSVWFACHLTGGMLG